MLDPWFKDWFVLLLIPVVLAAVVVLRRRQKVPALRFPSGVMVSSLPKTWKSRLRHLPLYLRLAVLVLFIVALAGPRQILDETQHQSEGIDIILVIDTSGSMRAEDFTMGGKRYNRLAVVKKVVDEFIDSRPSDRLGMVAFAGQAYTVSPLTTDHSWVKINLLRVDFGQMDDGTAIGSALSSGLLRLKNSPAKSKVIVLLTDGVNNRGKIEPLVAAQAAKAMKVRVYTIGAGTKGIAPVPVQDQFGRMFYNRMRMDIDEETLQKIAETTGGRYYRATDTDSLRRIYQEIDQLEKTKIENAGYREYKQLFPPVLILALALLGVEIFLANIVFMRLP